ncbi:MAG: tetratricopeptide repeat protein [Marinilabiliales bacterium]
MLKNGRSLKNNHKLRLLLYIITLFVITLITRYSAINNDFLKYWDDGEQVVQNNDIKKIDLERIKKIFSSYYVGMYQPVTTLTYAFDYKIAGLSSKWYHFSNILYHLIVVLLAFFFFKKLTSNELHGFLLSLVFAIHPSNIESIAWISARSTMLFTAFYLLALIFYFNYIKEKQLKFYLLSFIAFLLSCLSKSAAITFPVLLIVIDYFFGKINIKSLLGKIPFFIVSIIFGLITIYAREKAHHITDLSDYYTFPEMLLITIYSIFRYLIMFFIPHDYSAFYTYPEKIDMMLPLQYYIVPVLLMLLFSYFFIKSIKKKSKILFGLLFFIVTMSIMLKIIPAGLQVIADRYMYLPIIGIIISVYYLFKPFYTRFKYVVFALFGLYIVFFAYQSNQYIKYWKNDERLFLQTLKHDPDAVPVKNFLGIIYKNKQEYNKALEMYNSILNKYPGYGSAYNNRANIFKNIGKIDDAIQDYNMALLYEGETAEIFTNMGIVYAMKQDYRLAVNYFNKAIALNKSYYLPYYNRAKTFAEIGVFDKALDDLNKVVELKSDFSMAYFTRGMIYYKIGNNYNACKDISKANELGLNLAKDYIPKVCNEK